MGKLADLAKGMSPYLSVQPQEKVTALYKGFKVVPSRIDPAKEVFRYLLEVNGKEKYWDNGKMSIAFVLDKANVGDIIEISNDGNDKKGDYSVKITIGENASEVSSSDKPDVSKK